MKRNNNKQHRIVEEKDSLKFYRVSRLHNCSHRRSLIQIKWTPNLKLQANKRREHLLGMVPMIARNKMNKGP